MPAQDELLKDRLREWKQGLTPAWRDFFGAVEPDLDALGNLKALDSHPLPNKPDPSAGADEAVPRHLTRAFDGLAPGDVRVVVVGQDPYPGSEQATGRAFEDGRWKKEMPSGVALSLKRLLQSAAAHDQQKPEIAKDDQGWDTVCEAIQSGDLLPPTTPGYFNFLAEQGILFVNAAWTFSKGKGGSKGKAGKNPHKETHRKAWRPVMEHLLSNLIQRGGTTPVVFLILGGDALDIIQILIRAACKEIKSEGTRMTRIVTVYCAHPTSQKGPKKEKPNKTYFEYENPLKRVNDALIALGAAPIQWWPTLQDASNPTTPAKPAASSGNPL